MTEGGMVIVGGGMAGARAVVGLRAAGWQGPVSLVCAEALLPYDRPPLSKSAITGDGDPVPALHLDAGMLASLSVNLVIGTPASAIDCRAKRIDLADGSAMSYDKLLLATGARPRRLNLPGSERAITLRDFADAKTLRQNLRSGQSVAIIGGGFIGLELAASARSLGCTVTVIEVQPRILMRGVPAEIATVVHDRHLTEGVELVCGTAINAIEPGGVRLADGRVIAAGLVVAGVGATPDDKLAADAGLIVDNGIAVDGTLRTSDPDIFAAGDCCSFPHALFGGRRLRLESWRNAQDQGTLAAENMLGAARIYTAVPWFWSDQYDLSLQIAGLPSLAAEAVRRTLPGGAFIMFHRDGDGRLVGASGIGTGNAVARDIKLAEMLMARGISPAAAMLSDPAVSLKSLLKG